MDRAEAEALAWAASADNRRPPVDLYQQLTPDEAYRVQASVLHRWLSQGETLAGWKIGANSPAARTQYGPAAPFRGFLLKSREFRDTDEIDISALPGKALLECELCVEIATDLTGPAVSRDDVKQAIASIAPAFEIASVGALPGVDPGLIIADNVFQWAYVTGAPQRAPAGLNWGDIKCSVARDGESLQSGQGRDFIDDQLDSIAWLANHLSAYGLKLEAGQKIMSGSCLAPAPAAQGQSWRATFSTFGSIEMRLV